MADFSTEAELSLTVPRSELRSAKAQIQDGIGDVALSVSGSGSAAMATDGGGGRQSRRLFRMARQRTSFAEQTVEHLAAIREDVSEGGGLFGGGGMLGGLVGSARGAIGGISGGLVGGLSAGAITGALSIPASSVLAVSGILSLPATAILAVTGTVDLNAADILTTSGVMTLGIASILTVSGVLGLSAAGVLAVTGVVGLSAAAVLSVAGVLGLDASNVLNVTGSLAIGAAAALAVTGTLSLPAAGVIAVVGTISIGVAEIFDVQFGGGQDTNVPGIPGTATGQSPFQVTTPSGDTMPRYQDLQPVQNETQVESNPTYRVTVENKTDIQKELDQIRRERDREISDLERRIDRATR